MMSLENDPPKCNIWNPSLFLSSFSHCHVKGFSSKQIALKVDVIGAENMVFCRHVRASFSPEILQAGAVKGEFLKFIELRDVLINTDLMTTSTSSTCGRAITHAPQPTQRPHVQDDEASTIINLQLQPWRPDGWTYTAEIMSTSAEFKTKYVANSSPATHQTVRQQRGSGEDGHSHLADWWWYQLHFLEHAGIESVGARANCQ